MLQAIRYIKFVIVLKITHLINRKFPRYLEKMNTEYICFTKGYKIWQQLITSASL